MDFNTNTHKTQLQYKKNCKEQFKTRLIFLCIVIHNFHPIFSLLPMEGEVGQ